VLPLRKAGKARRSLEKIGNQKIRRRESATTVVRKAISRLTATLRKIIL
jgi:hypothetical protein